MYFRNYGLRKTWSDKCVKSAVSLYPSTGNTVNGPKQCSNLNDGTLRIILDECQGN